MGGRSYDSDFIDHVGSYAELLQHRAKNTPDRMLYTYLDDGENESAHMTYRDMDRKARRIASALLSVCSPGDRALLLYLPDLEYIAGFMGCLYAGVIAVPAYPPDPSRLSQTLPKLKAIAADSGARIALSTGMIIGFADQLFEKEPDLKKLYWLATDTLEESREDNWQTPVFGREKLAFLQYTSGSTGTPKGVMVSHGNLLENAALIQAGFEDTPETFGVSWLPPYHDMGLIGGILQPIYYGVGTVLMSPTSFLQKPLRWLRAISKYRGTTSGGPNFAYDLCVRKVTEEDRKNLDLSSWRVAFNGAEPVREETMNRFVETFAPCGFRKKAFYPCYGMAEATLFISGGAAGASPASTRIDGNLLQLNKAEKNAAGAKDAMRTLISCGQSKLSERVIVVDPATLFPCPDGRIGEIWVSGPNVTQGYWNRPEETDRSYKAYLADTKEGPYLRTGDLGFIENNEMYVTGRIKDMIIIRGRNHYPQDIEMAAESSHRTLRPGCGAAFPLDINGKERVAIVYEVQKADMGQQEADEIISAIHSAILENESINLFAVQLIKPRSIPKTSSGKLRRSTCKAAFLEGSLESVAMWRETDGRQILGPRPDDPIGTPGMPPEPLTPGVEEIRTWLLGKLSALIRIPPGEINVKTPFSRFGLDSAEAVGLAGDLETWLSKRIPPTIAYDYPTIEALSAHLSDISGNEPESGRRTNIHANEKESIAIVGIGCRFPGADTPEAFWRLIMEKIHAVSEVPAGRWDKEAYYHEKRGMPGKMNTKWGGFLKDVDRFDPAFFGISPREAAHMDPQQRLLMEVTWEAMENGGFAAEKLNDTNTGVFIGISASDYSRMHYNTPASTDAYAGPGNALCIAANRISYWLNLHGPSWAVDTACSSSLVAIHQACRSLRSGECDAALAGGVNMILSPQITISFSQAGMMAADGRCKSFDADADGYVRGEGCGVVILKRFSDALADGNEILAVIRGTAVNQDGRSNSLTAPSGPAQQAVIRTALADADVTPCQLGYVEAHGTGTAIGDPIELGSLKNVLIEGRSSEDTCWIGSVKSNIGHLEAASGMAGLIKVVMSLTNGVIPPNIHYNTPTPHVSIEDTPLAVPTRQQAWPEGKRRLAGISSFGFGGTNAHLILEEAPVRRVKEDARPRPHYLLTLSAKSEAGLRDLSDRYVLHLAQNTELLPADVCYSANIGRSHFSNRLGVAAASIDEMAQKLKAYASGETPAGLFAGIAGKAGNPPLAFLFTGQGSQYAGMAKSLFDTQPVFRQAVEECAAALDSDLERALLDIIFADAGDEGHEIHATGYTQPALFAIEYGLARMWESWGIAPAAVMGHSVGEYVAACIAGVFSLEDGLRLIAARGRLMQGLPAGGTMAAVLSEKEPVAAVLEKYDGKVCFAAFNGPNSQVISGEADAVETALAEMAAAGIKSKRLTVSHAFHSPLMAPMLYQFFEIASAVTYHPPKIYLISNRTGKPADSDIATPEYWCRHILEPVRFEESMKTLYREGIRIFLECGPDPVLLGMGRRCIDGKDCHWLPSLRRGRSDWMQLCASLGELYASGATVDWARVDKYYAKQRVTLPNYPFQRKRYWVEEETAPFLSAPRPQAHKNGFHRLLGRPVGSALLKKGDKLFESVIRPDSPSYLKDHEIFESVIFPAAGYLEMAMAAGCQALRENHLSLENVCFHRALFLSEDAPRTLQTVLSCRDDKEGYNFKIYSRREQAEADDGWALHADGMIRGLEASGETGASGEAVSPDQLSESFEVEVPVADFYAGLRRQGLNYGLKFRGIEKLWRKNGNALGKIRLPLKSNDTPEHYVFPPSLLDACFQALAGVMAGKTADTLLPVGIERMEISGANNGSLWCRTGEIRPSETGHEFAADLEIMDENGRPSARIKGLTLRSVKPEMFFSGKRKSAADWLYEIKWEKAPPAEPGDSPFADTPGRFLVFEDSAGLGASAAYLLENKGASCIRITPGEGFKYAPDTGRCVVNPESPEDFKQLISRASENHLPLHGVIHLWGRNLKLNPGDAIASTPMLACDSLLYLVQALASAGLPGLPRLWIITQGGLAVSEEDRVDITQAPLWGLGRVIALEHPSLHCTRIDLDPANAAEDAALLLNSLWRPDREDQIAFRRGERYVARLAQYNEKPGEAENIPAVPETVSYRLSTTGYGMLENLYLAPEERHAPGPDEVEIRVCASGLNFRDVLNALGMLKEVTRRLGIESADDLPFGGECAGVVVSAGGNVDRFKPGDEVLAAFAVGSLGKYVNVNQAYVVSKPQNLSFEEAATLPVTYLTAWYGLYQLADLKPGEKILIHAAAGGVGQAAVRLAQRAGAEIYATSSPGKWDFIKSMGIEHVMNSRTLDFEKQVMEKTGGKGVDVVFNSLNGDFIEKSLSVLKKGGRFMEIGKIGIWDLDRMHSHRPDVAYFPFDMIEVSGGNPGAITDMLTQIMEHVIKSEFSPLPLKVFPIQKAAEAFRFMAQAKHIGKVVISFPGSTPDEPQAAKPIVRDDAAYLITGGCGALGLRVAGWLCEKGARHLVLTGRRGPSPEAQKTIAALMEKGVRVVCARADISKKEDAFALIESIGMDTPPLAGIIHAAGIIDDAMLVNMTRESFARVMAPKVAGAWNLHQLTENIPLDFFVLFSSAAALFGSPGQGNYAAANAFMDGLAHLRRAQGKPALSVNWGPWAGSGMAADLERDNAGGSFFGGMDLIPPEQGIGILDRLISRNAVQAGVLPMDWPAFLKRFAKNAVPPVFGHFVDRRESGGSKTPPVLRDILHTAPANRMKSLSRHLRERVARVLGLESAEILDPARPLKEMGLDSLMAVELNNMIQNDLNVSLTAENFMENPSIDQLSVILLRSLASEGLLADDDPEKSPAAISIKAKSNGWVAYRKEKPGAAINLFCFHHMGGAASLFQSWPEEMPDAVDVCPVQLPGREGRRHEAPITDFHGLIDTLSGYLAPYLEKPFAFFGHSMGTLIAFELAHRLKEKHGVSPVHLFVAAMPPPSMNGKLIKEGFTVDESFMAHMEIPELLKGDKGFMDGWLSLFKADSRLFQAYRYNDKPPVDCPISVFGGAGDTLIGESELSGWRHHTASAFKLVMLPGQHMFPVQSKKELLAEIKKGLGVVE